MASHALNLHGSGADPDNYVRGGPENHFSH